MCDSGDGRGPIQDSISLLTTFKLANIDDTKHISAVLFERINRLVLEV